MSRPRGWSEKLWEDVSAFLELDPDRRRALEDASELEEFEKKALELRRVMLAEETRRAGA